MGLIIEYPLLKYNRIFCKYSTIGCVLERLKVINREVGSGNNNKWVNR